MFDKISVSPQVKRIVIISNKHGTSQVAERLGSVPTQEKKTDLGP